MYQITCNDKLIYDLRLNNRIVTSPTLTLELNKTGSLKFTIPSISDTKIDLLNGVLKVYDDGLKIYEGRALYNKKDFYNNNSIECEGILAYLLDSIVRPYEYHNMSVKNYLSTLLINHNSQVEAKKQFQLGNVTVIDNNDSLYRKSENYVNTWSEINEKLINRLGGYLVIREENGVRYLDYLAELNNVNNQIIMFGENLLDISQYLKAEDIRTVIIPIGKDKLTIAEVNEGKDYLENETAIGLYGRIWDTVEFQDVTIPQNLKKKGQAYLDNIINLSLTIELSAIDLGFINVDINKIKLGDWIRVYSKPHNLDNYFQVSKMTLNLEDPSQNKITLGKVINGLIEQRINDTKGIKETITYNKEGIKEELQADIQEVDNKTEINTVKINNTNNTLNKQEKYLILEI